MCILHLNCEGLTSDTKDSARTPPPSRKEIGNVLQGLQIFSAARTTPFDARLKTPHVATWITVSVTWFLKNKNSPEGQSQGTTLKCPIQRLWCVLWVSWFNQKDWYRNLIFPRLDQYVLKDVVFLALFKVFIPFSSKASY